MSNAQDAQRRSGVMRIGLQDWERNLIPQDREKTKNRKIEREIYNPEKMARDREEYRLSRVRKKIKEEEERVAQKKEAS